MGLNLDLEIKGDDVNALVARAVLESTIGDQVKKEVVAAVARLSQSYDNPLKGVIDREVIAMVTILLRRDYADAIQEKVKAAIADQITDEFINKIIEAGFKKDRY